MTSTTGLFDIQVNGFASVDFNDEKLSADALDHALEAMLACGVTACLPTLITAVPDVLEARFAALDAAVRGSRLGAAMVPGYHLEGPFLNPAEGYAGSHPPQAMCPPDAGLVQRFERESSRPILLITYAPEFDEEWRFAGAMRAKGKLLAVGHSAADAATIQQAAKTGVRLSTHLGNGLPQTLPKLNNTLFAQLACDDLSASFIADGVHTPPMALKSLLRAKSLSRSILVTDAVSAAATGQPGIYPFAGCDVERAEDGSVRLPGSRYLAGSSLTLDLAVRNIVHWGLAGFDDAIAMASDNPCNLLKETMAHHGIALPPGEAVWSEELKVVATRIGEFARRYG